MSDAWHAFSPPSGLFALSLPPDAALTQDSRIPAPAGYYYWSPDGTDATFSIYHQPPPGPTADAFLDQLSEVSAVVVEQDEADEAGAHHLVLQVSSEESRELWLDAESGARGETPGGPRHERIHFAFWPTAAQVFRAGYRCDLGVPGALIEQLEQILATFQPTTD